jgi:hypothetical protein
MSNEKLKGMKSVLPKYKTKETRTINWRICKTE